MTPGDKQLYDTFTEDTSAADIKIFKLNDLLLKSLIYSSLFLDLNSYYYVLYLCNIIHLLIQSTGFPGYVFLQPVVP